VFSFSILTFTDKFLILRIIERDMVSTVYWSSYEVPPSQAILIKLEFDRRSFEKVFNIKLHEIPFNRSRVVPDGQTDSRHDEAESLCAVLRMSFRKSV